MENESAIFSGAEHREYANHSALWLKKYLGYLKIMSEWFHEINEELPVPCRTNYRDTWFHYRKIYEHRDYIKVVQEQYALEEHLIRAIKDGINCYFQNYIDGLEIIYKAIKSEEFQSRAENDIYAIVGKGKAPLIMEKNWEIKLLENLETCRRESDFPKAVCAVWAKEMDLERTAGMLQRSLHKIKNYCMKLRLDGTEIYRPADDEEYIKECTKVYNELIDTLEELKLKNVWDVLADELRGES